MIRWQFQVYTYIHMIWVLEKRRISSEQKSAELPMGERPHDLEFPPPIATRRPPFSVPDRAQCEDPPAAHSLSHKYKFLGRKRWRCRRRRRVRWR